MIYAIDQSNGSLYTEEEYWEEYMYSLPDRGAVSLLWDKLPHLDIPDDQIEEARKKYAYIYAPLPKRGDLLVSRIDKCVYQVTNIIDGEIFIYRQPNNGFPRHTILDFPYDILTSQTFVSHADQEAYRKMHEKNEKILIWGK